MRLSTWLSIETTTIEKMQPTLLYVDDRYSNPFLRACCAEAVISSASCNSRQSNTLMVSFSTGSFKPDEPGSNNPAAIH